MELSERRQKVRMRSVAGGESARSDVGVMVIGYSGMMAVWAEVEVLCLAG